MGKVIGGTARQAGGRQPEDSGGVDRARDRVELQYQVLSAISEGRPLLEALSMLCSLVEGNLDSVVCSVMRKGDDGVLAVIAGPSLDDTAKGDLSGLVPGPCSGSCGAAVDAGTAVYVTDTAADPRWVDLREVAENYAIRACWSHPIVVDRNIFGTFAIFHRTTREPDAEDRRLLDTCAQLAAVAVRRARDQEQLEDQRRRLSILSGAMDQSRDGLAITDEQGVFTYMNDAHAQIFGYDDGAALVGQPWTVLYREDEQQRIGEQAMPNVFSGRPWRGETTGIRADGSDVLQDVTLSPLEGGGLLCATRDITEQKRSTARRVQASKLATLGEMAASVAHELNQPLSIIRMAADNIRRKLSRSDVSPQDIVKRLERISEQTMRASAIIDHMRMFGREAKEPREPVDLGQLICRAVELIGEQMRLQQVEVSLQLEDGCPRVSAHPIEFEQVILNLLTNARDALNDRGDGERRVLIRSRAERDEVVVEVEDTAGGIPEAVLPRLFEPFFTTKDIGKGTGLGLSVSYGIISDMGGSITAANTDRGACFRIRLPVAGSSAVDLSRD